MTQPILELLEAAAINVDEAERKAREARTFYNEVENLCYSYSWEPRTIDQIQVGQWGIVRNQNWLFQVTRIQRGHIEIGVHDALQPLIEQYDNGVGNFSYNNVLAFDYIPVEWESHDEDEGLWLLSDCLFAVYKGGD